jgi:Domain of unknown function (DUF4384)
MLAILFLCATLIVSARTPAAAQDRPPPPIRVSLSGHGHYRPGDHVSVHVETRDDGYVFVLHVDADRRLRVLFPRDPGDDNFVRGGQEIEILGRGGRETFTVDRAGRGVVYAAVSPDPYRFDSSYVVGGHWDLQALDQVEASRDPEADLTDFVRKMAQKGFDYDLVRYDVSREVAYAAPYYAPYPAPYYGSPFYYGYGPYFGYPGPFFGFGFGFTFGHAYRYGFPVYRGYYRRR